MHFISTERAPCDRSADSTSPFSKLSLLITVYRPDARALYSPLFVVLQLVNENQVRRLRGFPWLLFGRVLLFTFVMGWFAGGMISERRACCHMSVDALKSPWVGLWIKDLGDLSTFDATRVIHRLGVGYEGNGPPAQLEGEGDESQW